MGKRDNKTITIGSALPYVDTVPTVEEICVEENLLGYIKSGAAVEYSEEAHEEKDDLGRVSKIVTINEEALVKLGLITWNGETLQKLVDRCKVTTAADKRTVKIGGAGNAQGGYYALCFKHTDKNDGNVWVLIKGLNTAGFTITFSAEEGSLVEPEFKALPHDEAGTLIEFIEEIPAA